MWKRFLLAAAPLLLAGLVTATPAAAQRGRDLIPQAIAQVQTMQADPQMRALLANSRGVLLVPQYGHGAFIIGGRGGTGVLLLRTADGRWSNPAFFNLGGISIGLQAGGTTGQIAYVLMSDNAVRQFEQGNQFSLSAGAGLHVADFRGGGRTTDLTRNDIVAWSNTTGAYGGVDVGATNVSFDRQLTSDFYGVPDIGLRQVLDGQVRSPDADSLRRAMPR